MQIITLYRYIRPDGGTTVSPIEPSIDYSITYRVVADDGKTLTDGAVYTNIIDTDNPTDWEEVNALTEEEDMREALKILGVETEDI